MDFPLIVQNQATSILLLDQGFCVRYLNESAEHLMNTSARRAQGAAFAELVRGDEQLIGACHKAMADHAEIRLRNHELLLPSVMREKTVDCIVNPLDAGSERLLLLECSEVEGRSKLTRDEEFSRRQQSNRAVIRGMAHEIRNPLGGIRGAAQLMSEEAGSEAFIDYTRIIIEETDRLTELVNRMQAETRVDLEQRLNIHSIIEHVRRLLLVEFQGRASFVQDYDPSLPRVMGNSDLLIQALINVIRNAAEAVSENGSCGQVILRTRIDRLSTEGASKQVVRVEIEDNGPGIPEKIESRIFDPMVTGRSSGSGLGLPITAEIITQHGGVMDFQNEPGKTVFRLFIPVYEKEPEVKK